MKVIKSQGCTDTEKRLIELCDNTFLKLWTYPNPLKEDKKELCDLIAYFNNEIFIFFDRNSTTIQNKEKNIEVTWNRWFKEVIAKQIKTVKGAERYIKSGRKVFIDETEKASLPIEVQDDTKIYKIIVAHGAKEVCKEFSKENLTGSLGVVYGQKVEDFKVPFSVFLSKEEPVHVLDSESLEIVFKELDTFCDFSLYLREKERAIKSYDAVAYSGEEDLLANYQLNFDKKTNQHFIGELSTTANFLMIGEGEWKDYEASSIYSQKLEMNKISYMWDHFIQRTAENVLQDTAIGESITPFNCYHLQEMANEPRFFRKIIAEKLDEAFEKFPNHGKQILRQLTFISSYHKNKAYILLQLFDANPPSYQEYRDLRKDMLEVACGAAKIRFPHIEKIVGIATEPPKLCRSTSEDIILLDCIDWKDSDQEYYEKRNQDYQFFKKSNLRTMKGFEFKQESQIRRKIGRNEKCPCGSGLKYKKCCLKHA